MKIRYPFLVTTVFAVGLQWAAAQSHGGIEGRVLIAGLRKSLSGATVTVRGTKLQAVTNAEGEFVIHQVPPGVYVLSVTCAGFKAAEVPLVRVESGKLTRVPTITLEWEPIRVRGFVKDLRTGRAVEGAIVQIDGKGVQIATKTDAKGQFEFPPRGYDQTEVYSVRISARGYRTEVIRQVFAEPDVVLEVALEPDVELSQVTIPILYRSPMSALSYVQNLLTEYGHAQLASPEAIRIRDTRENLDRIVKALKEFDQVLRMWVDLGLIRATEKSGDAGLGTLPSQVIKQLKSLFRYRGYQVLDSGGSRIFEGQPCELILAGGEYKLRLENVEFMEGEPRLARMKVTLYSAKKHVDLLRTTANIPVGDTVVLGGARMESPDEALIVLLSVRELK